MTFSFSPKISIDFLRWLSTGLAPHHPTISNLSQLFFPHAATSHQDGHLHVHGAGWSRRRAALHLQPRIGLQSFHHRADGALVMGWGCEFGDLWDNYINYMILLYYYIILYIYTILYLYVENMIHIIIYIIYIYIYNIIHIGSCTCTVVHPEILGYLLWDLGDSGGLIHRWWRVCFESTCWISDLWGHSQLPLLKSPYFLSPSHFSGLLLVKLWQNPSFWRISSSFVTVRLQSAWWTSSCRNLGDLLTGAVGQLSKCDHVPNMLVWRYHYIHHTYVHI